jgi:hypothetical protein
VRCLRRFQIKSAHVAIVDRVMLILLLGSLTAAVVGLLLV